MNTCALCRTRFEGRRCPTCGTAAQPSAGLAQRPRQGRRGASQVNGPSSRGEVRGTVIQTQGPAPVKPPPNNWRRGSLLLATIAFLPVVIVIWMSLFFVRMVFAMVGFGGHHGGGRSLWDELIVFHLFGAMLRPADPIPVYHHVLQGPSGKVLVRQEGEFAAGCLFVGNDARLKCAERRGSLVVLSGYNDTLGASIAGKGNPWRVVFFLMVVVTIFAYSALLG